MATPTPAPAGPPPSEAIPRQNLIVKDGDVSRIAPASDGKTIYALDATNGRFYKSDSDNSGWADISDRIAGARPWNELAVSPDNPGTVAVVTDARREVFLSLDGGRSFGRSNLSDKLGPAEAVSSIAISPTYSKDTIDVIVGTSTRAAGGRVWVLQLAGPVAAWKDVSSGASGWLPATPAFTGVDVFAVRCSPGYQGDGAIVAVVSSNEHTYLYAGARNFAAGTVTWNTVRGYPVEVSQSGDDTPGTPLTYADIALPSDFSFSQSGLTRVFVNWSNKPRGVLPGAGDADDVYRVDGNRVTRLNVGEPIASLAYYGDSRQGRLLAGAVNTQAGGGASVQVYRTADPSSAHPVWEASQKPPTGRFEARVAWSPDGKIAYCGTSGSGPGDQSAVSRSQDGGVSWNQIGLINT